MNKHPTYLHDIPDFLRMIEKRNEGPPLPPNTILASLDVSSLYTNIPQEEGLEAVREALYTRNNTEVPTEFILRLLEIVLKNNIFEFNGDLFLQLIGTAMGTRPAPSYANLFMAKVIDPAIKELANKIESQSEPIDILKRFLDDIFLTYTGTIKSLHTLLDELNKLHPTIKFTMSHTTPPSIENPECGCEATHNLAFLDTQCKVENGKIVTDLYRKETDRNQYLLPSSCHPPHVTENIPFSLALRIVRICTHPEDREKRFEELKALLLSRDYKPGTVNNAIEKARSIQRQETLKKVVQSKDKKKTVFVISFDPRLPSISAIIQKHWRTMS